MDYQLNGLVGLFYNKPEIFDDLNEKILSLLFFL